MKKRVEVFWSKEESVNIFEKKNHTKIDAAVIQTGGFADAEVWYGE